MYIPFNGLAGKELGDDSGKKSQDHYNGKISKPAGGTAHKKG